jgi:hypothetical protein
MGKKYYVVARLFKDASLNVVPPRKLDLIWLDGQVAALPVFTSKKKALKYAVDPTNVLVFENVGIKKK